MTDKLYVILGPSSVGTGELSFLLNNSPDIWDEEWGDGLEQWQVVEGPDGEDVEGEISDIGTMFLHDEDFAIHGDALRLYTPRMRIKFQLSSADAYNLARLAKQGPRAISLSANNAADIRKYLDELKCENIVLISAYMDIWERGLMLYGMHEFNEVLEEVDDTTDRPKVYNEMIAKYLDSLEFDIDVQEMNQDQVDYKVPMSQWRNVDNIDSSLWEMFGLTPPSDEWIEKYKTIMKAKETLDKDEVMVLNDTVDSLVTTDKRGKYEGKILKVDI